MSLQGTLDTFALPDVLRLLASTAKTGHLRLEGNRGAGGLWIDTGHVVAAEADRLPAGSAPAQVIFELLRFSEGSFEFAGDMTTSSAGAPLDVEPLLDEAEALLAEWQEIEAVVPSLDAGIQLAGELTKASVTVSAAQWRFVAVIAGGTTVGALGQHFELGELDVSRSVKELVEAGLVVVGEVEPMPEPAPEPTPARASGNRKQTKTAAAAAAEPLAAELGALAALADQADGPDAPELARQLAQLGPDAARAVAAAAEASTDEEREAALASLAEDGEPINRGLLLKFLSSVRS